MGVRRSIVWEDRLIIPNIICAGGKDTCGGFIEKNQVGFKKKYQPRKYLYDHGPPLTYIIVSERLHRFPVARKCKFDFLIVTNGFAFAPQNRFIDWKGLKEIICSGTPRE